MDDLIISGRSSSASLRPKPKTKSVGVNFSKRKKSKDPSPNLTQSKESRASTTYLNSPSAANETGNPLLSTEDILQRLSESLPVPPGENYEEDIPVRESVVMKPDLFAKRYQTPGSEEAATKIQQQWRTHTEKQSTGDLREGLPVAPKLSEELRDLLEQEKIKMREEKERDAQKYRNPKLDLEKKKHEARLRAIEDLNKKREEKRVLQQKLVEEELKLASEVRTKVKVKKRNLVKKSPPKDVSPKSSNRPSTGDTQAEKYQMSPERATPIVKSPDASSGPDTTYDNLIDEIFLRNSRKIETGRSSVDSELTTPRVGWSDGGGQRVEQREKQRKEQLTEKNPESIRAEKRAYSSLMDTLKLLEAESDEALSEAKSSSIYIPPVPKLTQGEVYKLGAGHTASTMPAGKIKSLLHFLDHAETNYSPSEAATITSAVDYAKLASVSAVADEVTENIRDTQNQLSSKSEQVHILKTELTSTCNRTAELQAQMFATKLESDERAKAVAMLQRALDEQRDLTLRLTTEQEKDAQMRLANQKGQYETTVQRHLGFIDQLISDKKDLSEKVESVMMQLRTTEKKLGDKIRLLEDNQRVDMKKQKEAVEAAEKIKRERWISEKSNQIKEMTVKGLEPEIQKLISKNKADQKRLKALHEAELLEADERASKRFVSQVEELRVQLDDEKEAACAREREFAQRRYQKQLEQEEEAYQQQRRRLYTEVQEEKDRTAEILNKHRAGLDTERRTLEDEFNTKLAKIQAQHTIEVEGVQRGHENILRDLKLRIQVEKEQWLENQTQKQASNLMAREREIRAALRSERDKEIEMVISKLEEQSAVQTEETQATLDCRMRRLKDKYEAQIADLEHLNTNTQTKLNVMKERVTDLEADNIRLRGHIKSVERHSEDIEKVSSRLKAERDKVEEVIRGEFSERLVHLEEENKNLKTDLVECRTRNKLQIEKLGREHDREMSQVQDRIKSAFGKRDDVIKELNEKSTAASARADHLEALLIKQREQLLKPSVK